MCKVVGAILFGLLILVFIVAMAGFIASLLWWDEMADRDEKKEGGDK